MSQIVTSIEQATRLLDAGLSPETADFYWDERRWVGKSAKWPAVPLRLEMRDHRFGKPIPKDDKVGNLEFHFTPAWSLSKLLDIHGGYNAGTFYDSESLIESLVKSIVFLIDYGDIDSEYLVRHETD